MDRYEELRGWVAEVLNLPGAPCGEAREALLRALRETPRRAQLEAIEKRRTLYGTALAMLTSGEALRAAFESLHGALGDEVGVNVTTRIVREAVLAAKVAAWTKAAAGGVLEEGRASVIDWLRSDEAGRIAAGAAGDPWYVAGRLADALEGDEQRRDAAAEEDVVPENRGIGYVGDPHGPDSGEWPKPRSAPAGGGGSGAGVRVSADAGVRAAQEACSHPHVSAGGPGGRVCYACSAVLPLERAGEPDGLLGEAIVRHVCEAVQEAGEMVPAGVEEGAERALRELWDRGVLVGPEEEWPFVHYCRSALREIRDLMSGVEVHESQRGGVCSDCVDAVRQAREFAVRTLAETVPPSVEGGEDGPAVLVVPRPKLDALRELTSSGAHVCSCGGCEPQAFADCCRFEAALRELVGA